MEEKETVKLACPADMEYFVRKVLGGEYDIKGLEFASPPTILDIGANVGSFALWARRRWPGCDINSYEPHPDNFKCLKENCDAVGDVRWQPIRAAILGAVPAGRRFTEIYDGIANSGCASVDRPHGRGHAVDIVRARDLPSVDIVKLDCERCEGDILEEMDLQHVRAVMVEYHSADLRCRVDAACTAAGLALFSCDVYCAVSGVMKFVRVSKDSGDSQESR